MTTWVDCGHCPRTDGCANTCKGAVPRPKDRRKDRKPRLRGPFSRMPAAMWHYHDPETGARGFGLTPEGAYQNYLIWKDVDL